MIKNPFRMPDIKKRVEAENFAYTLIMWTFGIAFLTWMLWGMFKLVAFIVVTIACVLGIILGMYYTYTFLTYRYLVWKEKKNAA